MIVNDAPSDAALMLEMVIQKYHDRLVRAGVTIGIEFAHKAADSKEPTALKLHGRYCQAIASITPYRARVRGCKDAYVTVDNECWAKKNKQERVALLDHELTHFELDLDKDGNLRSDDRGRPKLKMRPHDWEIGGFDEVVQRHGVDTAPESVVVRQYLGRSKQLTLAFDAGELQSDNEYTALGDVDVPAA